METSSLKALLEARGWSQSDLARRIGLSRQAVSLWLRREGRVSVKSEHLLRLSEVLGVEVQDLLRPLPCLGEERAAVRATLLWDRLYGDLVDFALAVARWELRAVGRLVEVHGLYSAAKILGPSVWKRFPDYSRYIPPTRRQQLESLVRWRRSRAAS